MTEYTSVGITILKKLQSMSFDYILDTFGKFRKKKTRFTELEEKTVSLLTSFVSGKTDSKEFAVAFDNLRKIFIELTEKDGQMVIDEDTPLWLNSLLGLHYMKWLKYQQVKWYFEEHPDELVGGMEVRFDELQKMGYDERFVDTCKTILKELKG